MKTAITIRHVAFEYLGYYRTIRLLPAPGSNSQEINCIANYLTLILHHDG